MSNFGKPRWAPFMGVGEVDLERVGTRNAAIARAAYTEDLEPKYCLFDPVEPKLIKQIGTARMNDILTFPTARLLSVAIQCPPGPIVIDELNERVAEIYGYVPERARGAVVQGLRDLRQHRLGEVATEMHKRNRIAVSLDLGDTTFSSLAGQHLELAPHVSDQLLIDDVQVQNPVALAQQMPRLRRQQRHAE